MKSYMKVFRETERKLKNTDLLPYIKAIRTEGVHKAYRTAMAGFLESYISRADFLNVNEPLPSDDPDDYEFMRKPTIENDAGVSVDDDDWYDEDEETDEFDDFDISITRDSLFVKCHYESYPELNTDMLVMEDETKEYYFHFNVDRAPKSKLREVRMTLAPLQ